MALIRDAGVAGSWKAPQTNSSPVKYKPTQAEMNKLLTHPSLKSELLDKVASQKDIQALSVFMDSYKSSQLTSQERGAVSRVGDRFAVSSRQAARATAGSYGVAPETMKEITALRLHDYRTSEEFLGAKRIAESTSDEDLNFFELLKQATSTRDQFAGAAGEDRVRYGTALGQIMARLENRDPASFDPVEMENPYFLQGVDTTLYNLHTQYAGLDEAERVVSKAEKMAEELGVYTGIGADYVGLTPMQQKLLRQEVLFLYAKGGSAVDWNVGDEYAANEQMALDLAAGRAKPNGERVPDYMSQAQKDLQTTQEMRQLVHDALWDAKGTPLYDQALKNAQMDLDYLDGQDRLAQGLIDRYSPDADALAKAGEAQFREDGHKPSYNVLKAQAPPLWLAEDLEETLKSYAEETGQEAPEPMTREGDAYKTAAATDYKNLAETELTGADSIGMDRYRLTIMTEQERKTYYAYYAQDKDKAHTYAQSLDYTLSKRAAEYSAEADRAFASGNVFQQLGAAAISILNTPLKAAGAAYSVLSHLRGDRINPYAASFSPSMQQQNHREQLKQNAIDAYGEDSLATKAIHFISDVVFGAADSLIASQTLGLIGYSAAGGADTVRDAIFRGGTQDQALALGAAVMFAEIVTEMIPFENLNKGFKEGFTLRGLGIAVGGETLGESLSSLLGDMADRKIMLDQSLFEIAVREYEDERLSEDQARTRASQDALRGYVYEGIVGGFSGGLSYGAAGATGSIKQGKQTKAEQQIIKNATNPADVSGTLTGLLAEYEVGGNRPQSDTQARAEALDTRVANSLAQETRTEGLERAEQNQAEYRKMTALEQEQALAQTSQELADLLDIRQELTPEEFQARRAEAMERSRLAREGLVPVAEQRAEQNQQPYQERTEAPQPQTMEEIRQELETIDPAAPDAQARIAELQAQAEIAGQLRAEQATPETPQDTLAPDIRERVADGRVSQDTAAFLAQAFPQQAEMQRELLRVLSGRDMSALGQQMLVAEMQSTQLRAQAEGRGVRAADFMSSEAMELAPERAEIAARVSQMVAEDISTSQKTAGTQEQQAALAEVRSYFEGGPVFDLLDSLAQDIRAGEANLRQAAQTAWQELNRIVREQIHDGVIEPAMNRAADVIQGLMGIHGPASLRTFFEGTLQAMDGADYAIQQETMSNIQAVAELPSEAPSKGLLDSMIQGETKVIPETLGELNRLAEMDVNAPEYQEAVETFREEAVIARDVAGQISNGALNGLDALETQVRLARDATAEAQRNYDQVNARAETVIADYQAFIDQVAAAPAVTPEAVKEQQARLEGVKAVQSQRQAAELKLNKARAQLAELEGRHQADFNAQMSRLREDATGRRIAALQTEQTLLEQTPAQPDTPLKTPENAPEGVQRYAMNPGARPVDMPTAVKPGPVKSAHSIFTELGLALKAPYNPNLRQFDRNLRSETPGYFVPASGVVHTQAAQDINVAAHEYGHWLDKALRLGSHPIISDVVAYLRESSPDMMRRYSKPGELTSEAVAEVVRHWFVNREQAAQRYGSLISDMENGMKQSGVYRAFETARKQLERTLTAAVTQQTEARVSMGDGKGAVQDMLSPDTLERMRAKIFDATLPLDKLTKADQKALGDAFMVSQDSRTIALKNNRVDNYVRQVFNENLIDIYGDVVLNRGFSDNFEGIKPKDMKAFSNYLLQYHELDRARAGKSIYKNQFTPEQIQATITEYERAHPDWRGKHEALNEWYDAFMREYVVKPGILTARQYETMHAMYPNYVPTYRVVEPDNSGFKGRQGDAQKGVKRAGLSDLDIQNPIENMGRQIAFYVQQAHKLHLGNVFADQIDRLDGMGYIAEKVQPDMNYSPEIDRLVKEAQRKGEQYREDILEADPTVDTKNLETLEAVLLDGARDAVFTLSDQASGANVINILAPDGSYRSYVVHDEGVLRALEGAPPGKVGGLLKLAGNVTRMISLTATSANPLFAATNAIRDIFTATTYGSVASNPATMTAKWLAMLPQTVAAKHGKGKYAEAWRLYETTSEMGARFSARIGRNSKAMLESATKPRSTKSAAIKALKMVTLQNVNDLIENNTRFLEFTQGKSALGGKNMEQLESYEGRLRAMMASTGVTVDFARKGSALGMRQLAAMTPFLNASLQGVHKTASILSHENQGRRGQIVSKTVVNGLMLGAIQALTMGMLLDDNEKKEYDAMDEGFKNQNVFVKLGKETLLRIPLSQDGLFQALYAGGRMLGQAFTGEGSADADALISTAKGILGEQFNFSFMFSPILNVRENKTWYGGQIEPYTVEELPMAQRYDEKTTEAAKWLSENLGLLSPMQWDYLIPQYTGIYGRLAVNTLQAMQGDQALIPAFWDTVKKQAASRFTTSPAYSTQAYQSFREGQADMRSIVALAGLGRAIPSFDPALSQSEVDSAVREADKLLKKGGALYDVQQEISAKWKELNHLAADETLTEAQRDEQTKQVRQDINMLAFEGNGILAEYGAKYFTGADRLKARTVDNNLIRLAPEDFNIVKAMGDELFQRYQRNDPAAQTLMGLAQRYDNSDFVTAKPSMTWKGLDEVKMDDARMRRINTAYYGALEKEMNKYSAELKNPGLSEARAKEIMASARDIAGDKAREAAFEGTDQKYTVEAKGWYEDAVDRKDPTAKTALDLAKQHDDVYYVSRYPSMSWKGFDVKTASPAKIIEIERTYYAIIEEGLRQHGDELRRVDKATARKIMERISNDAAVAAKKVALRKD